MLRLAHRGASRQGVALHARRLWVTHCYMPRSSAASPHSSIRMRHATSKEDVLLRSGVQPALRRFIQEVNATREEGKAQEADAMVAFKVMRYEHQAKAAHDAMVRDIAKKDIEVISKERDLISKDRDIKEKQLEVAKKDLEIAELIADRNLLLGKAGWLDARGILEYVEETAQGVEDDRADTAGLPRQKLTRAEKWHMELSERKSLLQCMLRIDLVNNIDDAVRLIRKAFAQCNTHIHELKSAQAGLVRKVVIASPPLSEQVAEAICCVCHAHGIPVEVRQG